MPTNWQWDCLRICYILKMKVLVECPTATFPYGSWHLESINANNYISPLVFTALFVTVHSDLI